MLSENTLQVTYEVLNTGDSELYFSVGGHPAFRIPLEPSSGYDDYYLQFNRKENAGRWPISPEGLIKNKPVPLLEDSDYLPLTKELFLSDALVLKDLRSGVVAVRSSKSMHGLEFHFQGFPFLGIWAAKHADFVCIEPWCGIADAVDHNGQLSEKEGINKLEPQELFTRTWSVSFF
jgi:galactose mutarotase-like enzyme